MLTKIYKYNYDGYTLLIFMEMKILRDCITCQITNCCRELGFALNIFEDVQGERFVHNLHLLNQVLRRYSSDGITKRTEKTSFVKCKFNELVRLNS